MIAVNQAIGRVIRHRHDYGVIVFLDKRYFDDRWAYRDLVSEWIRGWTVEKAEIEEVVVLI